MSRLSEVEARLAAAVIEPWEHVERKFDGGRVREHSVETHHHVIADNLSPNGAELIAHAPADLAALVAVVRAVGAIHREIDDGRGPHCFEDAEDWPCPTVQAIDGLEAS